MRTSLFLPSNVSSYKYCRRQDFCLEEGTGGLTVELDGRSREENFLSHFLNVNVLPTSSNAVWCNLYHHSKSLFCLSPKIKNKRRPFPSFLTEFHLIIPKYVLGFHFSKQCEGEKYNYRHTITQSVRKV